MRATVSRAFRNLSIQFVKQSYLKQHVKGFGWDEVDYLWHDLVYLLRKRKTGGWFVDTCTWTFLKWNLCHISEYML
jgi:hypothetical protein